MSRYVVTVKRQARATTPTDWADQLREVEGVEQVVGNVRRVIVVAEAGSIALIEAVLGPDFWVEAESNYSLLDSDSSRAAL